MKQNSLFLSIISLAFCFQTTVCHDVAHASWTVVGAGPTGIMAVGLILDSGVPEHKIFWIDPEFKVGRIGKYYQNIPGNGRVEQYIEFLSQCNIFSQINSKSLDYLYSLPDKQTPELKVLVKPLMDITKFLRHKVNVIEDTMTALDFHNDQWHIKTNSTNFISENVVLATGAHPRKMTFQGIDQISLDLALDKSKLAKKLEPNDTVAVIGSGHSAILILKYLSELSVSGIVHFSIKPVVFPIPMKGGIAHKEAGLKGEVAKWAKEILEKNPPKNLTRLQNTKEALDEWLPKCTKVIYAAGFQRNELPAINGDKSVYDKYDRSSGVISKHLYGLGIAFAQQEIDPIGNTENLVGLPYLKFDALIDALKQKKLVSLN